MSHAECELRLDIRYRNNRLYQLITAQGLSVLQFCIKTKTHSTIVGELLNLTKSPIRKNGKYRKTCLQIADYFFEDVKELFPLDLYNIKQTELSIELHMEQLSLQDCMFLSVEEKVTDDVFLGQLKNKIEVVLATLTPRQEKIVRLYFGLGFDESGQVMPAHDAVEIAELMGVTRSRVDQILVKALRDLRHPFRSNKLKAFV